MKSRDCYRRSTGRQLGVIDPARKGEFLERSAEILGGELIPASRIDGKGDFMKLVEGKNIHFETLDIVSLVRPNARARPYFTYVEPDLIRASTGPTPIGDPGCTPPNGDRSQPPNGGGSTPPTGGGCSPPSAAESAPPTEAESSPPADGESAPPDESDSPPASSQCFQDDAASAWGIKATLGNATATGAGVRVALLDAGLDFDHEAFRGRAFSRISFVDGEVEDDEYGHGTACASIICGQPEANGRRIGVAPGVDLVVVKIFDEAEESPDTRTLAAINWALAHGCKIISMSIGERVDASEPYSDVFETTAKAALDNHNALLVAGTGNDSCRSNDEFRAVNHPANCPSVLAVGAIDNCAAMADFSNRELPPGGDVNLVAPGVLVRVANARAVSNLYSLRDGTSFAVPFVSGIAALWMESAGLDGVALWNKLQATVNPLSAALPKEDKGFGLVQGP